MAHETNPSNSPVNTDMDCSYPSIATHGVVGWLRALTAGSGMTRTPNGKLPCLADCIGWIEPQVIDGKSLEGSCPMVAVIRARKLTENAARNTDVDLAKKTKRPITDSIMSILRPHRHEAPIAAPQPTVRTIPEQSGYIDNQELSSEDLLEAFRAANVREISTAPGGVGRQVARDTADFLGGLLIEHRQRRS